MIVYLSAIICCTSLFTRVLIMKKLWWAPIFGIAQEGLWLVLFLLTAGTWPLLFLTAGYITIHAISIPKWRRERAIHQPERTKEV